VLWSGHSLVDHFVGLLSPGWPSRAMLVPGGPSWLGYSFGPNNLAGQCKMAALFLKLLRNTFPFHLSALSLIKMLSDSVVEAGLLTHPLSHRN
jgi:hypothetical protein